jgi:hypothetical protein
VCLCLRHCGPGAVSFESWGSSAQPWGPKLPCALRHRPSLNAECKVSSLRTFASFLASPCASLLPPLCLAPCASLMPRSLCLPFASLLPPLCLPYAFLSPPEPCCLPFCLNATLELGEALVNARCICCAQACTETHERAPDTASRPMHVLARCSRDAHGDGVLCRHQHVSVNCARASWCCTSC